MVPLSNRENVGIFPILSGAAPLQFSNSRRSPLGSGVAVRALALALALRIALLLLGGCLSGFGV